MENNQVLPNDSIVVISPQYCTPNQVDLYTAKRVKNITEGRNLGVFDINGNNIFKVIKASFFSTRRILLDSAGVPLVSLKPMKFSVPRRWKVYRGDSSDSKDMLFSVKRSNFLQFKSSFDVFLASNTEEHACDFKIKQNFSRKSCFIYQGDSDSIIAEMHKNKAARDNVHGKEKFLATVYPNVDYAFVIAMRVVLDEFNTARKRGIAGANGGGGGGG